MVSPASFCPAVSVATTAPRTITLCPISDTKPRPKAPFLSVLRLDSIRLLNTAVPSRARWLINKYPSALQPLVDRTLQNDDSRMTLGNGSSTGSRVASDRELVGHANPHPHWPPTDHRRSEQGGDQSRSEEHTSELQSLAYLVCRL